MSANLNKLVVMLEMQNAMNTKVHEQWFTQGFEWYRAIWVECAEMLDHHGWKWWPNSLRSLQCRGHCWGRHCSYIGRRHVVVPLQPAWRSQNANLVRIVAIAVGCGGRVAKQRRLDVETEGYGEGGEVGLHSSWLLESEELRGRGGSVQDQSDHVA